MIKLFTVLMSPDAPTSVGETLLSGFIGQGPKVEAFEKALEGAYGQKVLTMNSCTSALDLALHLADARAGDEVITTPVACTASSGVIVNRGARPVWADVDPVTGLIDPEDVARKVTTRTKAILAVDFGGRRCDYAKLSNARVTDHIMVIEDAAHLGPITNGIIRSHADFICWSFQAIKFLTTGDGGALSVPLLYDYDRAKLLRWYGLDRTKGESFRCQQDIKEAGFKYHMNDLAATIGLANLRLAQDAVLTHRRNAAQYYGALQNVEGIIVLPYDPTCHYWLFPILVEDPCLQWDFIHYMKKHHDIECSPVHGRNDKHTAFTFPNGPLPGVDAFCSREVCIPVGWWLTDVEIAAVIAAVRGWPEYLKTHNLYDISSEGQ